MFVGISQESSKIMVAKYLNIPFIQKTSVNSHLKPLAHKLGMIYKGKDKNWLVTDIAMELTSMKKIAILNTGSEVAAEDAVLQLS